MLPRYTDLMLFSTAKLSRADNELYFNVSVKMFFILTCSFAA